MLQMNILSSSTYILQPYQDHLYYVTKVRSFSVYSLLSSLTIVHVFTVKLICLLLNLNTVKFNTGSRVVLDWVISPTYERVPVSP